VTSSARPAFYALSPGGWRDYVTLLHPPYTLWHLSYVAIGAGLAPHLGYARLALTLAAFFLAVGVGAHALDELKDRPLGTRIGDRTLIALAATSIGGAVAIGVGGAIAREPWLLLFVGVGAFIVVVYNLELFGGRFHGDPWFALAWGGFPLLTGYFAVAGRIRLEAVLAAVFATLSSHAQRLLSTPVRTVRRRTASVSGTIVYRDGREEPLDAESLMRIPEAALKALAAAVVSLAVALVVLHAS
jgi:heme O synthase-like polyprenyltransferase